MDIREISSSYLDRWNTLISNVTGDIDIYDYHINIIGNKDHIVEDLTKGSVRLQAGMIVTVPESDEMEENFINLALP